MVTFQTVGGFSFPSSWRVKLHNRCLSQAKPEHHEHPWIGGWLRLEMTDETVEEVLQESEKKISKLLSVLDVTMNKVNKRECDEERIQNMKTLLALIQCQ